MITLQEAKDYMGITATGTDSLITMQISYVTSEIEAITSRSLVEATYNEVLTYGVSQFDGQDNPELDLREDYRQLFLREYPARGLTLQYKGTTVDTDDYKLYGDQGRIELYNRELNDIQGWITATYTAGYVSATATTYSTPNDLRLIILDGVKQMFANSGVVKQGSGDVTSKKVGDFSVSYGTTGNLSNAGLMKTYLQSNMHIINKYRRYAL